MDSSSETSISHCLHQRGATPGTVSLPNTKKPGRTVLAELRSQCAPWEDPSWASAMHSGRFYVSKAPQPVSMSYVGLLPMLKGWALTREAHLPHGRNTEHWTPTAGKCQAQRGPAAGQCAWED